MKGKKENRKEGVHISTNMVTNQFTSVKKKNSIIHHRCHRTCYNFSQIVCQ